MDNTIFCSEKMHIVARKGKAGHIGQTTLCPSGKGGQVVSGLTCYSRQRQSVRTFLQTSSSSPSPSSSPLDATSGISPKLSRRVHRSSRNCSASSLSIQPIVAQSILRRTHWPTKSAYCVNRRGNVYPDANVDTIGTDRIRVKIPRPV